MSKAKDITGIKFNNLTAIKLSHISSGWVHHWYFECVCGKVKIMAKNTVTCGRVISCGCIRNEALRLSVITHGLSNHQMYSVWNSMKDRCYYEGHVHYARYGGRGIYVCDRWLNSLENFIEDMYPSYIEGLQLDRIENDGIYEKGNCKWSTVREQAINRSSTVFLTARGETMCIKDWSVKLGINYSTIRQRVVAGYSDEECVYGIKEENKFTWKKMLVLHESTGNKYRTIGLAADALGLSKSHLGKILCGERPDSVGIKYIPCC